MKLNDLKDLKVIKKNLAPEPEKPAGPPPQPPVHITAAKSIIHNNNSA